MAPAATRCEATASSINVFEGVLTRHLESRSQTKSCAYINESLDLAFISHRFLAADCGLSSAIAMPFVAQSMILLSARAQFHQMIGLNVAVQSTLTYSKFRLADDKVCYY